MRQFCKTKITALLLFASLILLAADGIASLNWDGAEELAPGISYIHAKLTTPRLMEIHAARINLKQADLGFYTTPKADIWGKPMPDYPELNAVTRRQSCRAFLKEARTKKELDMVLAVNSSPWSPWKMPYTHKYAAKLGLLVAQGDILDADDRGRPALVILKDGSFTFHTKQSPVPINDIYIALPAFEYILDNGTIPASTQTRKDLAPRTGYGLSQERDTLIIIVIDGRQNDFSLGATVPEVAQILRQLGAACGLNMDGGGSSSMVIWDKNGTHQQKKLWSSDDKSVFLNHQPHGVERNNGNNFGIYLKK